MLKDLFDFQGNDDEGSFIPFLGPDDQNEIGEGEAYPEVLPILALKNTVLFPGIVIPIGLGRDKSLKAINYAYENDRLVAVISQRSPRTQAPGQDDLYAVGTVARILKIIKTAEGSATAILQGRKRLQLEAILENEPFLKGRVSILDYREPQNDMEFNAKIASVKDLSQKIIELTPSLPPEASVMLQNIANNAFLLNFITSNLGLEVSDKQLILETSDLSQKADKVLVRMNKELQLLQLKDKIESKTRTDLEKQQRDYFLNQQLKTIQEELGNNPQDQEIARLRDRAAKMKWPKEVAAVFEKDLRKLKRLNPQVAEYSVMMTYMELMLDLPWNIYTEDNFDLKSVQKTLDADHFGLEKVKDRILEHLAVLKLKGDMKAPILCLVGPPGVGKTSLGKSVATALNRKFVRMSLGGLHDESEIRGHRKTYIGAMPGRIVQSLKKVQSSNPVFILDEIDKIGNNFRGDPSSALLEVLDPEQNTTFHDNYLDLEYNLSKILFIATANSLNTIQPALRDRMEIIRISGYSTEEKVEIAKKHLIPRQRKEHGLKASQVRLSKKAIHYLIQNYTRESGVRSLNRHIAALMRSVARKVAMDEEYDPALKSATINEILGPTRYTRDQYQKVNVPGVVVGLAWTSVGGDILFIEVSLSKGKGNLQMTGNLGSVMKESASTALSYIKANAELLGIDIKAFAENDVHIHVPEGAIPKDGPSAGITMLTALVSAFTGKKVKPNLAMTGEITLRGKVLPVGGIKEKILAAKRAGIREIILCKENEKHVNEINDNYIKGLVFHYVERMGEVLELAIK